MYTRDKVYLVVWYEYYMMVLTELIGQGADNYVSLNSFPNLISYVWKAAKALH